MTRHQQMHQGILVIGTLSFATVLGLTGVETLKVRARSVGIGISELIGRALEKDTNIVIDLLIRAKALRVLSV